MLVSLLDALVRKTLVVEALVVKTLVATWCLYVRQSLSAVLVGKTLVVAR